MKPDYQGRTAKQVTDSEKANRRLLIAALALVIVLCVVSMVGCAPVRHEVIQGVPVTFNDLTPCERGANGCYVAGHIYVSEFDPQALTHELQHHDGMRHGPWFTRGALVCARIEVQGATNWTVGKLLCRNSRGDFMEIEG